MRQMNPRVRARESTLTLDTTTGAALLRQSHFLDHSDGHCVQLQNAVPAGFLAPSGQHSFHHSVRAHDPCTWHEPVLGSYHAHRHEHDLWITPAAWEPRTQRWIPQSLQFQV